MNWIPSFNNLARYGVYFRDLCPLCFKYKESTFHSLRGCSSLNAIKDDCEFLREIPYVKCMVFFDFSLACFYQLSTAEFEYFVIVVWRISFRRNHWVNMKLMIPHDGVTI
ncbi:hypothetical protein ACOSQ3_016198 [Xanthoceras sorbifolium]